jgi:hypothetical protein
MKDDEKGKRTGTEPSGEPIEELKKLDRGEFLKTVGVGVAAAGIGLVTGKPSALAATEPDSTRSGIQKLMRSLLENPSRAKDFLESPQTVGEEFGVRLTEADASKIKEVFTKLAAEVGSGLNATHTEYTDSGHHNSVTNPLQRKQPVTPKQPTGGTRRK